MNKVAKKICSPSTKVDKVSKAVIFLRTSFFVSSLCLGVVLKSIEKSLPVFRAVLTSAGVADSSLAEFCSRSYDDHSE